MSGDNSTSRVLNQDEIDSLLGFREAADGPRERSGIEAIIDSGMVSYERLPMLEVVFDRLVRMKSTSLRNFTSDNVEVRDRKRKVCTPVTNAHLGCRILLEKKNIMYTIDI